MSNAEDGKDENVEDEDDDTEALKPTGIVWEIVEQDRRDSRSLSPSSVLETRHGYKRRSLTMLSEKKAGARLSTA